MALTTLEQTLPPAISAHFDGIAFTKVYSTKPASRRWCGSDGPSVQLDKAGNVFVDTELIQACHVLDDADNARDLSARVSAELIRRRVVEALVGESDRHMAWSRAEDWSRLSDWRSWPKRRGENSSMAFAHARGMDSARSDLATAVSVYVAETRLPSELTGYPGCRLRAKWSFIREQLGGVSQLAAHCAPLQDVGLIGASARLHLFYVQSSARSMASVAGHLGLSVGPGESNPGESKDSATTVFQLVANTRGARAGPARALLGVAGAYASEIVTESDERFLSRYSRENRSVTRYRLALDVNQTVRLLERLDDARQGWSRRYSFLTRNCTYLPRLLVEWATSQEFRLPRAHGPDVLMAALARNGLIEPAEPTSLTEFSVQERVRATQVTASWRAATADSAGRVPVAWRRTVHSELAQLAASATLTDAVQAARTLVAAEELELLLATRRSASARNAPTLAQYWGAGLSEVAGNEVVANHADWLRAQMLDVLRSSRERRLTSTKDGMHTSLRRYELAGGLRSDLRGVWPVVSWRSTAFEFGLGDNRQFMYARGLQAQVLKHTISLAGGSDGSVALYGQATALQVARVFGARVGGNPGLRMMVGTMQREPTGTPFLVRFVQAGPMVELLQRGEHSSHIILGAEAVAHGSGPFPQVWQEHWAKGVAGALVASTQLGSSRDPLRRITMSGSLFAPWVGDGWTRLWESDGGAVIRLGTVSGAAVAGVLNARVWRERAQGDPLRRDDVLETQIGVVVERF